ncbi:predicted protein [Chaetoceros tenuissimus]|uniref:BTB domain-containing protein n=1 Tax=Chaetoceros tenuissimus TaxID=426638 RepID=A0AAD3CQH6_9STRA|nr:predicted protein [Chaetoceros tenuissimus]
MILLKTPKSHFDRLLDKTLGGSDIELIFHEQLGSRKEAKSNKEKVEEARTRRIHAHKSFLLSCDLVKLTFEGDRFAESANGQMNIHLSTDCFNEIDRFLRFCYDGILEVDDSWKPYPHADCLVPLCKFADYMQCDSLRQVILDYWRTQLDNGLAYANIVFYGIEASDEECIKAANERLPMKRSSFFADHIELWLDDGSSDMLEALSLLMYHPFSREKKIINEEKAHILFFLGEYLAEMTRSARSNIPIDIFADLLTRFIPGTISETDFAALILDYIEDNDITSPFHVQSLLSIVDFSVIPKHQLLNWLLPAIEKFEKLPPLFSSTIKDLASLSGAVKLRCDFSKKVLNDVVVVLDCGCVLDSSTAKDLCMQINRNNFLIKKRCCQPNFHRGKSCKSSTQFQKELREKINDCHDASSSLESRAIETYFSKKAAKSNELKSTIQSKEFKKPPSKKKPSRKRNAFEVSPPKVIRFLDQTASIGEDTYVYIAVDETTDTKFKHVLDKFALAKVEQFSLKYNYDVDGTVYLEKIRHRDADGRFVRFCTDNTWAHCLSEQDIDLEKWDFTNDQIIARWHDSSILIAPRPRV